MGRNRRAAILFRDSSAYLLPIYQVFYQEGDVMLELRKFDTHLLEDARLCMLEMDAGGDPSICIDKDYSNGIV